jgi:dipeptidyl-peptidase-4
MSTLPSPADTFPRQHARTQRLTLGEPRNFTVAPNGKRIVFARSAGGSDPVNMLWVLDLESGRERCVFDPKASIESTGELTAEEARRRERAREGAGGVVSYACDSAVTKAVTVLAGQLFLVDLTGTEEQPVSTVPIAPGIFDARLSPDARLIAYTRGADLYVCDHSGNETLIAHDDSPDVTWGLADFIAAEEMGRQRGYWWSPEGTHIAACRVDTTHVDVWHIADPAHPERPATEHRYPAAGTTNPEVTLHIADIMKGTSTPVSLPEGNEYLNSVHWSTAGLIVQVQTRNQHDITIVRVDPATGSGTPVATDHDDAWIELVQGVPALRPNGQLVTCADRDGARRLMIDGAPVTPSSMQVRSVVSVGDDIVFVANALDTPWFHHIHRIDAAGSMTTVVDGDVIASASASGGRMVVREADLVSPRANFRVIDGPLIASHSETMLVEPNVVIRTLSRPTGDVSVAVLTPRDGSKHPLPVLFDPYGGPHAQRVLGSQLAFATSQWFADQGFVVVVADGRGTPGRGSAYERAVHMDLAGPVLDDQVAVLDALTMWEPRADLSRVAIRGWSFGGYLAALAVLRRPDKFHCGVAGAPVTEWRLYDTHYTERYLGNPDLDAAPYDTTSLLPEAVRATRPLLLIHGLADDNVVAAHTLQLSSALLSAGRDHEVLPLSGVTHMTPQEVVAENLLLHQLAFIRRAIAMRSR